MQPTYTLAAHPSSYSFHTNNFQLIFFYSYTLHFFFLFPSLRINLFSVGKIDIAMLSHSYKYAYR